MKGLENVLIKPMMTEKSTKETETANRYSFLVNVKANKNQVKAAVEKYFDVKVLNVRTAVMPGKPKRSGSKGGMKKTQAAKRAWVKIQDGQKIEFFKGI